MKYILLLIVSCFPFLAWCQGSFQLRDKIPLTLKFELINNVILVPVTINGIKFSFLLDTGVKETILFANTRDSLYLHNQNKIRFQGIGSEGGIDGILSTDNIFEIEGVAVDSLHSIYVIQAEDLDISSDVGVAINGILGSHFFHSFPIKLDYLKKQLTLYPANYDYSKEIRKYESSEIKIERYRPYINANISFRDKSLKVKMLLDMGNTDAAMVFPFRIDGFEVSEPFVEEYIGRGFSGVIHGKRNRINKISLEDFVIQYPIVAYPDSSAVFERNLAKNRIGSIGNQILQRFHILIDYQKEMIYLRKNRNFNKPFVLNMAGMDVKHDGMEWSKQLVRINRTKNRDPMQPQNKGVTINFDNDNVQYNFILKPIYRISGIRKESPAEKAGVRVGDLLISINGRSVGGLSLEKIMQRLQSKPGDQIKLVVERFGKLMDVRFRLVDPIPYREI